eukprot:GDKK01075471.1.p1 GENE.GDKK01075471.1~~GDKK01075471.1.p1  ORF type:complete len:188 (-),score=12.03 GDKK01075471.1:98-634(-)
MFKFAVFLLIISLSYCYTPLYSKMWGVVSKKPEFDLPTAYPKIQVTKNLLKCSNASRIFCFFNSNCFYDIEEGKCRNRGCQDLGLGFLSKMKIPEYQYHLYKPKRSFPYKSRAHVAVGRGEIYRLCVADKSCTWDAVFHVCRSVNSPSMIQMNSYVPNIDFDQLLAPYNPFRQSQNMV